MTLPMPSWNKTCHMNLVVQDKAHFIGTGDQPKLPVRLLTRRMINRGMPMPVNLFNRSGDRELCLIGKKVIDAKSSSLTIRVENQVKS